MRCVELVETWLRRFENLSDHQPPEKTENYGVVGG